MMFELIWRKDSRKLGNVTRTACIANRRVSIVFGIMLGGLLFLGTSPAHATYSGLVLIPTADMVPVGEYAVELQFDGSLGACKADTELLNTQFGFSSRLEAGLDFDLSKGVDSRILTNAKYIISPGGENRPSLALGTFNLAPNFKHTPYVVATQDFKAMRGHLGIMRTDSKNRLFVGADCPINDKISLMADYTGGEENSSSVGINYQPSDRFGILSGVQFPNAGGDTLFTVHFTLSGEFRNARIGD